MAIRQLRWLGLSDDAVAGRVSRGQLHRRHRGVYSVGYAVPTAAARFVAAVLACGDHACLSHRSAAMHLGLMRYVERAPDVTVPQSGPRHVEGVRLHRARRLDRRDVIRRDGLWVTSPARTILDLSAATPSRALRRMVRQAQVEHRVNVRQLLELLARANGHRGVANLRTAIVDGPAPTRSDLEDIVLDLIDEVTDERPEINARLELDGEMIEPDFLWRERKLVIEADSRRFHDAPIVQAEDARKQAILEADGHRVLRIRYEQAVRRRSQTLARIRALLED